MRLTRSFVLLAITSASLRAQQKIGSVAMQDATVSGSLEVTGGRAVLVGASSVTARDHAAEVQLERGGIVRVCQTSGLKFSSSNAAQASAAPLMLALDRGAVEVKMTATPSDMLLTPDLRFTVKGSGPLDLRVRVTPNGDTCVEQHGASSPTIVIKDSFGEASYEVKPNQHVLFEHGNLREVVDHETSPCGCPEPPPKISIAEAALRPGGNGKISGEQAAGEHPFPAAESTGLAPTPELPPQTPAGEVHTQVSASLAYEAPTTSPPPTPPTSSAPLPVPPPAPPPAPAPKPHGFGHAIGRFFKRLFGGS